MATASPSCKTRSIRRKVEDRKNAAGLDAGAGAETETDIVSLTAKNGNSQRSSSSIVRLPDKFTTKAIGLGSSDLETLLKKQTWLRTHQISLPDGSESLRRVVDATLVFAQEEAGTALCISEQGLLLTCSHCIAESEDEFDHEELHCLLFASGQVIRANCIAWDSRRDLALLRITEAQAPHQSRFPTIPIAHTPPKLKDDFLCIGHPGSKDLETTLPGIPTNYDTLHASTGVFRGYAKGQDLQDNSEIGALKHDCWTYWGHSGAPLVLRRTGELAGLHSSWDEATGMRRGVPLEAIAEFLKEYEALPTED